MAAGWEERFGSLQDWASACPVCKGQLFVGLTAEQLVAPFKDADGGDRCACWLLYHAMRILWAGGFPKGYLEFNWDSTSSSVLAGKMDEKTPDGVKWYERFPNSYVWEWSKADETAVDYWASNMKVVALKGLSLVLWGEKGIGKTALATALAKELVKSRGIDSAGVKSEFVAKFLVSDVLYEALSQGHKGQNLAEPAMKADILVIDDLRLGYKGYIATEYLERLHTMLQHRSANALPTIVTTNKIAQGQDFDSNSIAEFLGIAKDRVPKSYGKYRFVRLTNRALRQVSDWSV